MDLATSEVGACIAPVTAAAVLPPSVGVFAELVKRIESSPPDYSALMQGDDCGTEEGVGQQDSSDWKEEEAGSRSVTDTMNEAIHGRDREQR